MLRALPRGRTGLAKLASRRQLTLGIKAKPVGTVGFTPIGPLWRVEHAFAQRCRWRRLALLRGQRGKRQGAARRFVHGLPTRPHRQPAQVLEVDLRFQYLGGLPDVGPEAVVVLIDRVL
jgi:hypothetical protein